MLFVLLYNVLLLSNFNTSINTNYRCWQDDTRCCSILELCSEFGFCARGSVSLKDRDKTTWMYQRSK